MTLHLLPLRRMTMNTHFGPIIAPMNGMLMRMMTATLSLFIGGAATAVDQVSIVATTPVCIEDDAANPSVFTISRTSGSGNLPVTIDFSALQHLDLITVCHQGSPMVHGQ